MEDSKTDTGTFAVVTDTRLDTLPELCRRLTDESPLPTLLITDSNHIIRYVNPAFCSLTEKTQEELLERPFAEALPEGAHNSSSALLDRVLATGSSEDLAEQEHAHSGMSSIYWTYSVWAVKDDQQRPEGLMLQVRDTSAAVLYRRQVIAMNEELLLSGIKQHELKETAESLNVRLQRSIEETHHRVKNNLQVVVALAEMQAVSEGATLPASALNRIATHVRSLADLHELLMQRAKADIHDEAIPTRVMLERLIFLLQPAFGDRRIRYDAAPMMLPMNRSTALSLLLSELVSNALKHGKGDVFVTLEAFAQEARLTVRDYGTGFPPGFDPEKAANTGLDLIMSMARHDLRGDVKFLNHPEGGASVIVTFPQ